MINWPHRIEDSILFEVLDAKKTLSDFYIKQKVHVNSTYNSILVRYDYTIRNIYSEISMISELLKAVEAPVSRTYNLIHIPVCYDEEFGIDLIRVSTKNELTKDEFIRTHAGTDYRVFFIGFLPGFLYLGGLDDRLGCPRLETPRQKIPKGSVAIGGNQTGIYPRSSPGGWNIIGRSPLDLFSPEKDPPTIALPGDKVRFVPVDREEYFNIESGIRKDDYEIVKETLYD